jgi:magnesium transporter
VRKDDGLDIGAVIDRWDSSPDLARFGVGYLPYGLLDYVVDTQFESVQSNRLNIITKKVTGWAAIIAVPTLITGYFGMNVPYPGFSEKAGFIASIAAMILAALVLYIIFKRKDWL